MFWISIQKYKLQKGCAFNPPHMRYNDNSQDNQNIQTAALIISMYDDCAVNTDSHSQSKLYGICQTFTVVIVLVLQPMVYNKRSESSKVTK